MQQEAYADHPLPIGEGQTISQPYIVALMTEALELTGSEKTLELGTGSGYQAAILAELSARLYTIERIQPLLEKARKVLEGLGYHNVEYKVYNGTMGWEEHQPYDAVMVTAGAPKIPQPLIDQLADRGRLIIPVGNRYSQELIRVTRKGGQLVEKSFGGCRFVSLMGEHGWKEE
jgi:protein-L-isoaspartate(D-aspartate) O-methyltransferase